MKNTKKAKTGAKLKKPLVRGSAMRDLELLDPGAKQIKGGVRKRDAQKRAGRKRLGD